MKNGWTTRRFGELLRIKHGFAFKGEFFADAGDHILLTPGNFNESGGLKLKGNKEKYYVGPFPEEFLLKKGDLLVAMTDLTQAAPILGSAAFVPRDDLFLHNQRLGKVIDIRTGSVLPQFLFFLFNDPRTRSRVKASASGATVRHTSPSRIYEIPVSLPDMQLQRKIAAILSVYDELIENNLRRIEILEEMARSLYREWFVEFRFPGHERARLVDSPLGKIPQGWTTRPLSAIASVNAVSLSPRSAPKEILYIDISSVTPGRIAPPTPFSFEEAPGRARRIVSHGDVLWSCVRPNRRSYALVMNPAPNTIASTGFAVLTATGVSFSFLFHATTTDEFVSYLSNHATGAAYPAVTASTFENAQVLVPDLAPLERFDELSTPLVEQADILLRKVDVLRRTRDLLLPRLISGELDVSDLDIEAESIPA